MTDQALVVPATSPGRIRRWWWTSGIGSVVLFVCLAFVLPSSSGEGRSPDDIARRYADGHDAFVTGMYIAGLSTVLQLVFVGVVAAQLAGARARTGALAFVGVTTGAVAGALQLGALAVITSLAYRTAATAPTEVTYALYDLSSILSVFSSPPEAVFLTCTSLGILATSRHRGIGAVLLAALGFLLAAAHLVGGASLRLSADDTLDLLDVHGDYGFLTLLGFLAWMAAVCVFWFRSGPAGSREPSGGRPTRHRRARAI